MLVYVMRHDPALVIGLGLIGIAGALWFHMLIEMERVGLGPYERNTTGPDGLSIPCGRA